MAKPVKNKKKVILIVVSIFALLAIANEVFILGNIPYLMKWHECGNKPYISSKNWSIGFGAQPTRVVVTNHPSYLDTKQAWLIGDVNDTKMSCTLDEAKSYYTDGYYDIHLEID